MDAVLQIGLAIVGSGTITTIYTNWHADRSRKKNCDTAEKKVLLALCRDRILAVSKCYKHEGYIPLDEYESFEELVKAYEYMGGNGTVKKMAEQVKALPVKE